MLQVCYVVVSTGWDRHAQMAWVSAQTVRRQQPNARIIVIAECPSAAASDLLQRKLGEVADVLLMKTSDVPDAVGKSRFHKMALREYVKGDVLYMDSDTLAVAPLAGVLDAEGDVGAVCDCNNDPRDGRFPPEFEQSFRELGWTYPLPYYLNAGVILFRDTPAAHAFGREWQQRFRAATSARRHVWDQATFNSALFASGVPHVILPHRFNAVVVKRNYRPRDSSILHFFGSPEEQQGTLLEHLIEHLERTGTFDEATYRRSVSRGHPWGPRPKAWQLFQSGNYIQAALAKAEQAAGDTWHRVAMRKANDVSTGANR